MHFLSAKYKSSKVLVTWLPSAPSLSSRCAIVLRWNIQPMRDLWCAASCARTTSMSGKTAPERCREQNKHRTKKNREPDRQRKRTWLVVFIFFSTKQQMVWRCGSSKRKPSCFNDIHVPVYTIIVASMSNAKTTFPHICWLHRPRLPGGVLTRGGANNGRHPQGRLPTAAAHACSELTEDANSINHNGGNPFRRPIAPAPRRAIWEQLTCNRISI